jgi:hypothetical protein
VPFYIAFRLAGSIREVAVATKRSKGLAVKLFLSRVAVLLFLSLFDNRKERHFFYNNDDGDF